ncbi:monooxygenase FAD-binding protein [Paludibacter propionicigenes WB4]|uniref:Monooxygenase FAD-binding protein n=1 Tax=Paludibacter propionicigenes (strain DSM 17365 / JCM 13257 / WB4) TaxID=694427 RepID=E4T0H6_PALPW|nr:NAD(P)/FAD-dependent oxidoreductase [Paludibacter propionicigenes]ADQ78335.1 monooxygenase FAD-binding protein [Paludibacter propionicigenes WB4]
MHELIQLSLIPEQAEKPELLTKQVADKLEVSPARITRIRTTKKSIDARSFQPKVNLTVEVYWDEEAPAHEKPVFAYQSVDNKKPVLIIGAGPAGLFAALKLIENGIKPIILERGRNTHARKEDIAQLNRNNGINIDSNYCFGEGGAGTFSDGKLYTRSKKKGNTERIFEIFHYHGAAEEILYEAHPHIGSDKLPIVIENISKTITSCGGEIHFEQKLTEILIENNQVVGCKTADGNTYNAKALILATGHSAHDIYEMLHNQGILLEPKGFAMGVRVEHPQSLIDSIQYHCKERGSYLPAASYNLVDQVNDRGVYSFCMCPGGHIVPAASNQNEIVVNGMSASQRNSPYANSGIVVEIRPEDIPEDFKEYGVLAGLKFQQYVENLAYKNNGGLKQAAPAQRLGDFVKGKLSADLPACSYLPGLISSPLHFWLPDIISSRLREGFKKFDRKMRGYLTNDAVVVGVETRSSAAVRIPRDPETGQHTVIKGLFPAGEGSGYSGGITSSAIDGENAAIFVANYLK